jgi:SPP1 family predicted phage head-tail adaptor
MSLVRRAGQRRHKVALQSIPTTTASSTGFSGTWTTYASVWASVIPATAGQQERIAAMTTEAPITHLVEMDYRSDLRSTHRVLMDGTRALYVMGQQNVDERGKTLLLSCEERVE